jgi:hypothetical protein
MLQLKFMRLFFAVACVFASLSAAAWEQYATAKAVEATYLPASIAFQVTVPPSQCPSGGLTWAPVGATDAAKVDNAKAVTAVLMTALTSGQQLYIYGVGCAVDHMYLMQ